MEESMIEAVLPPVTYNVVESGWEMAPGKKTDERVVIARGNYFDVLEYFKARHKKGKPFQSKFSLDHNRKEFDRFIDPNRSDSGFVGGTTGEFFNGVEDLSLYRQKRDELRKSDLFTKITESFAFDNKRRRIRCEYDGDYDIDKRWDAQPFDKAFAKPTPVKIVKLNVEVSFSCGVPAETINEYAAFVASIVDTLESNGVMCEIYISHRSVCIDGGWGTGSGTTSEDNRFLLKKSNQYLSSQEILKAISSKSLRVLFFAMTCWNIDQVKRPVGGGLGRPYEAGKVWELSGDTVHIYSVPSYKDQHNIADALAKFLQPKDKHETVD